MFCYVLVKSDFLKYSVTLISNYSKNFFSMIYNFGMIHVLFKEFKMYGEIRKVKNVTTGFFIDKL